MTDEFRSGYASQGSGEAPVAYLDGVHWQRLLEPESDDTGLASWLALQCEQIPGAMRGVLVTRRTGPFRPLAFWPEQGATSRFLMETVNKALSQRIDLIQDNPDDRSVVGIARLVRRDAKVIAVIGAEVREPSERARRDILRRLQWGSAWVEVFERRHTGHTDTHAIERLTLALDAIAVAGEHDGFRASAMAALTALSVQLGAARIAFGRRSIRGCQVSALSNTTRFDRRVSEVRSLAKAMDEAVDQVSAVAIQDGKADDNHLVAKAALHLSEARDTGTVIVQPYVRNGRPAGAMVFEWAKDEAPPAHIIDAVPDITALLAPILHDKLLEERWLLTRAIGILRRHIVRLIGPGYFGRKMTLVVLTIVVGFFAVYKTEFRVAADARLRGAIERVVMASIDGYIVEANPRAGDQVNTGDLLVRFDDIEYQLERYAWTARKLQYEAEYAQALAEFDRAGVNILRSRIEEADAQIRLNETRIDLSRIRAPFDSVVVSGDLSQSLGQSVQRGDELFRIAPLDEYKVSIEVPEADILHISPGSTGTLVLTSLPTTPLEFTVDTVTPVTATSDGRNAFVVEALLSDPGSAPVAPGMEGVAKIAAGERHLIWIWTRRVTDWIQLAWWRWSP